MSDNPSSLLSNERQQKITIGAQPIDKVRFGGSTKGRTIYLADRARVACSFGLDDNAHDKTVPRGSVVPRKNS